MRAAVAAPAAAGVYYIGQSSWNGTSGRPGTGLFQRPALPFFSLEQSLFALDAPTVASEAAILPQHAVTRDED